MKTQTTICYTIQPCALGQVLIAQSDKGLCALFLADTKAELNKELKASFPQDNLVMDEASLKSITKKVLAYMNKPSRSFDQPLDMRGTPFQKKVWQALLKIPYGKTLSYTDLAKQLGRPKAVRAVANACGANAIAIIIPCHRVLKKDGSVSGYRSGVQRKIQLLQNEKIL